MSKDMERPVNDDKLIDDFVLLELNSSSKKHIHHNVTSLLDLPDEILLAICLYLPPAYVLYSFFTPDRPEMRLHRLIFDYYNKFKFDELSNDEYDYISSLFCYSKHSCQPESLILSNEHVTCLTRFFSDIRMNISSSIFDNLKYLTLIDCSTQDLKSICIYHINLSKIQYLHVTIRERNENLNMNLFEDYNASINQIIFNKQIGSLHTFSIEVSNGIMLNKSLTSHKTLRNINLFLQTIDDLYVLLDGLLPNVQTMIIQLCHRRLLTCLPPKRTSICSQLTEFTLLEPRIGLITDNIKCILGYMPNLLKLTLSIRDTYDPIFCHGPFFESILTEYVSHLEQFNYTMTHRIVDQTLIQDFVRWPMNSVSYENENTKWIHICSLPWPSNKDDRRKLPIINDGSITSVTLDVERTQYVNHIMITKSDQFLQLRTHFYRACQITTCLEIDFKLPDRISKLILTKEIPISSINSIVQPSVHHLIVQRRLINEKEIINLAHQFPNIKFLELLFPLEKCLYICCLKSLFSRNDNIEKSCIWPQLIHFSTDMYSQQLNLIGSNTKLHDWLVQNTDLKYHKYPFHVRFSFPIISIWF